MPVFHPAYLKSTWKSTQFPPIAPPRCVLSNIPSHLQYSPCNFHLLLRWPQFFKKTEREHHGIPGCFFPPKRLVPWKSSTAAKDSYKCIDGCPACLELAICQQEMLTLALVEVSGWHLVMVFDGRMSNDPPVQMILIIYSWTKPLFWVQIILVKKKYPSDLNSYIFKTVTCFFRTHPSAPRQNTFPSPTFHHPWRTKGLIAGRLHFPSGWSQTCPYHG